MCVCVWERDRRHTAGRPAGRSVHGAGHGALVRAGGRALVEARFKRREENKVLRAQRAARRAARIASVRAATQQTATAMLHHMIKNGATTFAAWRAVARMQHQRREVAMQRVARVRRFFLESVFVAWLAVAYDPPNLSRRQRHCRRGGWQR